MTAPTNKAAFYADFGALSALKRDAKADSGKALRGVAQQFESLFTEMMLKSMRAAKVGDTTTDTQEMDFYQGMFDQQLAVSLSKGKGIGLADMLVQQLTRSGLVPTATSAAIQHDADPVAGSAASSPTTTVLPVQLQQGASLNTAADPASSVTPTVDSQPPQDNQPWPPASPEEFVRRLLPHAQAAATQLGVDAETLVAHAALETGWGKHLPGGSEANGSSFNFFGIKTSSAWQGQRVKASTVEYEQGTAIKRVEQFKAYQSPTDCFNDYANLLAGARYTATHQSGSNADQFAQALQRGGYATDPQYAAKLNAVAGAVRAIQVGAAQADS
jgi:flagellar protein FlgJ